MIRQQFYTSTARSINGTAGFGIKAQSAGIEPAVAQVLEQYNRYHAPHSLAPDNVEAMPVSLSFYALGGGLWGITHCKYVGLDHTGTRWGNFFAHSLLCDEQALDAIEFAPIRLLNTALWVTQDDAERAELPLLSEPISAPPLPLADAAAFLNAVPARRQHLANLIQATIDYAQSGRRVIIVDEAPAMVEWLRALTLALPIRYRQQVSYTTYHRDPNALNFVITCTTLDGDFRFTDADYRFQFCVFNYTEGKFSEGIVPGRAAKALSEAVCRGEAVVLAEANRYADSLQSTALSDLDGIACLQELAELAADHRQDDVLICACELLTKASPAAAGFAWEAVRNLTLEAMDRNCLGSLKILIPAYHTLSREEGMDLLQEDCTRYLTRYLPTPSAASVIELFAVVLGSLPEVREVLASRTTAADWAAFLAEADTAPRPAEDCWQFIARAGQEALAAGELSLWRALTQWAERHQSVLDMQVADEVLKQVDLPQQRRRALVDTLGVRSLKAAFDRWLQLSLGVLRAGVRNGATDWEDDVLRCTDALISQPDPQRHLPVVMQYLRDLPVVALAVFNSLLAARPDLAEECARQYASAGLSLQAIIAQLPEAPSLRPLLAALLSQAQTPTALALQLHQIMTADWPASLGDTQDKLASEALSTALSMMRSSADVEAFVQAAPSVRQVPLEYGKLLVMKAGLAQGLITVEDPDDLYAMNQALTAAVATETANGPSPLIVQARVCLCASEALSRARGRAPWSRVLPVLAQIEACEPSPPLYAAYLRTVCAGLRKDLPDLSLESLTEALEKMFVARMSHEFITASVEVIKQHGGRGTDRSAAVERMIEFIINNARKPETVAPTAELLRLLPKPEMEALSERYLDRLGEGGAARWWGDCYTEASKGLLSRLFRR